MRNRFVVGIHHAFRCDCNVPSTAAAVAFSHQDLRVHDAVACVCRPSTLRAKFGASTARPAVHATDLEEDGPVECEYLFSLLPQN